jgi:hypothetical protein
MQKIIYILIIIVFSGCQTLSLIGNKEKRHQKKLAKIRLESPQLFEEQIDTLIKIDTVTKIVLIPEKRIDTLFEWKNAENTWEWSLNETPDDPKKFDWTDFEWLINESKEVRDSTGKLEATLDVKLNKNRLRTNIKVLHQIDTFIFTKIDTITKIINQETVKTGTIRRTPWYLYAIIGGLGAIILFLFFKKKNKQS